jgi:hypothetical protein
MANETASAVGNNGKLSENNENGRNGKLWQLAYQWRNQ